MKYSKFSKIKIFLLLFILSHSITVHSKIYKLQLLDKSTQIPIQDAAVYYTQGKLNIGTLSDPQGGVEINCMQDSCILSIQHINYKVIQKKVIYSSSLQRIYLIAKTQALQDIVVTAQESKAITSTSNIDQRAMQHLQPNSIADVFSLLPGGTKQHTTMTTSQTATLRETGTSNENYAISSLGTAFIIDGSPINTDANLQYVAQRTGMGEDKSRSTVNRGVDMRSISTDDIEKIEITRGIASVEYGELTSGLVKIKRKQKASHYHIRLKSDGFTQLAFLGKGFELIPKKDYLNVSIDYLNSRRDPRSSLENYKRFNSSVRYTHKFEKGNTHYKYYTNINYSGSLDDEKRDAEIQKHSKDYYKSSYNKIAWNNRLSIQNPENKYYNNFTFSTSISYAKNTIKQQRFVSLARDQAMPISTQEGVHDGLYLPYKYIANYEVDGQPFYAHIKALSSGSIRYKNTVNKWKTGAEFTISKNFGKGQIFDSRRPLSPSTSTRPRPYYSIPSKNLLSAFIENKLSINISQNKLHIRAGIRASQLIDLPQNYKMHNKLFIEPRLNIDWQFKDIILNNDPLHIHITAGVGQQTKLPTLAQLYPADIYYDIIQMNYYNMNPDYKRLNIKTTIIKPQNPNLQEATNNKCEIRTQLEWKKYNLSMTLFYENMNDGFRQNLNLVSLEYKDYDESKINHATLSGQPDLNKVPYTHKKILQGYRHYENGSRITKKGFEFQFSTPRINYVNTRITLNGAWFQTIYVNSKPQFYYSTTQVINNKSVNDYYVGYYNWQDGYKRELLNLNIILDTYFKRLGLTFSTTIQIHGYDSDQRLSKNGTPIAYIDRDLIMHPYTTQDQEDVMKRTLTIKVNNALFTQRQVTPISAFLNFRATKEIGKNAKMAFFIDNLFDYLPEYKGDNGHVIRRSSNIYFGMELNLSI